MPGLDVNEEQALAAYPPETEVIELTAANGEVLRGVFIPADEDAPVVLHLLETTGSAFSDKLGYDALASQIADLGLASLLVDYRGVGTSQGKRSPKHFSEDVELMWNEAVRRAGRPERVLLRGVSLGTIAVTVLLEQGARPGAVELLLPVRAETVTAKFARDVYGSLLSFVARIAYGDVAPVDLYAILDAVDVPLLVITAEEETLMSAAELATLEEVVERGLDRTFLVHPGDHYLAAIEARALLTKELPFFTEGLPESLATEVARRARSARALSGLDDELSARFPAGSPERARFDAVAAFALRADPVHVAAAALAGTPPLSAARLRWRTERRPVEPTTPETLRAFYDLSDPAGRLPIDLIERASQPLDFKARYGGAVIPYEPGQIAHIASVGGVGCGWELRIQVGLIETGLNVDFAEFGRALAARGLGGEDASRQLTRIMLKGYRFPDRMRDSLEVHWKGSWQELVPDPSPPTGFSLSVPTLKE
jgi:hypothetical protein